MSAAAAAPAGRSDLGVRTVTGLALIVVAIACLVYGLTPFWLLISAAALAMIGEWAAMAATPRWQTWLAFLGLAPALVLDQPHVEAPDAFALAALLAGTAIVALVTRNVRLGAGMLYAGLPTLAIFYLHGQYDGIDLTIWTLAIVWATDIGAYFSGRRFGGPRLAPVVSPNKTWAGLIGGIVAAALAGALMARVLHVPHRLPGFAGLLAIAAQAGDLYESAMKRRAGVKDSGHILPGHGGAMDRLDGVVPVACLVALLVAAGIA